MKVSSLNVPVFHPVNIWSDLLSCCSLSYTHTHTHTDALKLIPYCGDYSGSVPQAPHLWVWLFPQVFGQWEAFISRMFLTLPHLNDSKKWSLKCSFKIQNKKTKQKSNCSLGFLNAADVSAECAETTSRSIVSQVTVSTTEKQNKCYFV